MKRIDKQNGKYRKRGHKIVEDFIAHSWNDSEGKYVNFNYQGIKDEGKLDRLLLEQQHYRCCYCMRTIAYKCHTTLEHVIPHKLKNTEELVFYKGYKFLRKMVRFFSDKEPLNVKLKYPPYPHFCAYENLVVSCDGSIPDPEHPECVLPSRLHECCNNYRGSKLIKPLFFMRHIDKLIVYETDGELTFDEGYDSGKHLIGNTIKAVRLDHPTLKLMRRTWAVIAADGDYNTEDVKKACTDEALREEILESTMILRDDAASLRLPIYWNTLYSYNWFYGYYKRLRQNRLLN